MRGTWIQRCPLSSVLVVLTTARKVLYSVHCKLDAAAMHYRANCACARLCAAFRWPELLAE